MLGDTPLLKKSLMLGIIILFIFSTIAPITLGYNVKTKNDVLSIEKENFFIIPFYFSLTVLFYSYFIKRSCSFFTSIFYCKEMK